MLGKKNQLNVWHTTLKMTDENKENYEHSLWKLKKNSNCQMLLKYQLKIVHAVFSYAFAIIGLLFQDCK